MDKIIATLMIMYPSRLSRVEWMSISPFWEIMLGNIPCDEILEAIERYGRHNRYYMPVPLQILAMLGGDR